MSDHDGGQCGGGRTHWSSGQVDDYLPNLAAHSVQRIPDGDGDCLGRLKAPLHGRATTGLTPSRFRRLLVQQTASPRSAGPIHDPGLVQCPAYLVPSPPVVLHQTSQLNDVSAEPGQDQVALLPVAPELRRESRDLVF